MTRVLQVAAPAHFGGLERVVHALVAGQRARGHDVHVVSVVSPGDSNTPFHDPFFAMGVEVHVIELPSRAYLKERRLFRDLCTRVRPDVVHSHGHRPDIVDSGVARGLGISTVSTMHGFFHQNAWKGRLTARLQVAALRRFSAVVAVSTALEDDLRSQGVPPRILTAIPNGFSEMAPPLARAEARKALGIPDEAFVAGWVGRVAPQKALEVALAAMEGVRDLPITLSVVGDGEDLSAMQQYARARGIGERVIWHGARTNAPQLMRAFDVFVLSSRWEGTPIVLFEAMSAGIPVVATAVGGVPDVVSALEAILVPAEDAHALAAGIRNVFSDRDAAAERAATAKQRLRAEFALDKWVDRYDALYERIVTRRSSSS